MLSEEQLIRRAMQEIVPIFGKPYLQKNFNKILRSDGIINEGREYMLFLGIKTRDDLPEKEANEKGWTVYGLVHIDTETGIRTKLEYAVE